MGIQSERLCANVVRGLVMDAVQRANSGHPGMPLGMAEAGVVLWSRFLSFDPADPKWPNRDRFVLSAGHGSMLLYALLHLSGFDLSLDDIREFRQWGSRTPGHPEYGHTPGVETTTGPLGQGLANGVGMAIAERWLATRFNQPDFELIDHYTYVVAGDGCLMEGISHEACSLAGHLGLGRLIVLWDANGISIDGATSLATGENALQRFESYGWHTGDADGHDPESVAAALQAARTASAKPSVIACRTVIGYGSPNRAGTARAHGEPLGEDEVRSTKKALGLPAELTFHIPECAGQPLREAARHGARRRDDWLPLLDAYRAQFPEKALEFESIHADEERHYLKGMPADFWGMEAIATRAASGKVLERLSAEMPNLLGGSADLTGSNKTLVAGECAMSVSDYSGRYIHYGVREHAMGAVMNGLALHGGVVPFGGTFLVFADYMRPSLRLAAMMGLQVIYVFTHDSIGVGEDGPTHQPVEQVLSLRAIPGLTVIRPADATETVEAWRAAMNRRSGPTALVLTRQKLPVLQRDSAAGFADARGLRCGAYVLADCAQPKVLLMASGSEVHIALQAQEVLSGRGVQARVVSVPSWEIFDEMPREYREEVMPASLSARVAVEAGVSMGWERYVGSGGVIVGIDRFGASAPSDRVFRELGLTGSAVAEAAQRLI
ncbi:MAG TPA: transketolase [Anaerolineales bacterium]|nr:transketolase [Anaerolineales bacterium]|tara:strand:+ start:1708 stop:3705 length:1998 start_codon:yes stop_codon:yes gene_type:complete